MSRGLGKTQQDILRWLNVQPDQWLHTHGTGGLYFLMHKGEPTEAQLRSCRRALAKLITSGLVETGYKFRDDGTHRRTRYIRLILPAHRV